MAAIPETTRAPLHVRGPDLYSTAYEAVAVLLSAESHALPKRLWEPCCGPGAIVRPLRRLGYQVLASDLKDWGCPDSHPGYDVLDIHAPGEFDGIVTNPPFRIAHKAATAMLSQSAYVTLFFRLQFLESNERHGWFSHMGLSRVHIITDRLPMMHRYGWTGRRIGKGRQAYAWFVFDRRQGQRRAAPTLHFWSWRREVKFHPPHKGDLV